MLQWQWNCLSLFTIKSSQWKGHAIILIIFFFLKHSVNSTKEENESIEIVRVFFNNFYMRKPIWPYCHCWFVKTVKLDFKARHFKISIIRKNWFATWPDAVEFYLFWKFINNFYFLLAISRSHDKYLLWFAV